MQLTKSNTLRGEITVPGDKSISHRSIMFGSLAKGTTEVTNFLQGADCLSTINCFRQMGISIENSSGTIHIYGKGLDGLQAPVNVLDAGNSGTTTRLLAGILAAQPFESTLTGDASIQTRPMKRIVEPLSQMGASIASMNQNGCAPLHITGKELHAIHYNSPVASAQVKSAILLAGLYADGITKVTEPTLSRNHSEIMLRYFGAQIHSDNLSVSIAPRPDLQGRKINVPGDISSAAYFLAAGLIVPDSDILIKNVGMNPTRSGIINIIRNMGGQISLLNENTSSGEPAADIHVRSSSLKGTVIEGDIIPTLIDEIPVLAVLAAYAQGCTVIRDAAELKVKESNRIDVTVRNLKAMGADITATNDGMIIQGGKPLHGAVINSHLDHRIAMSFAVAALQAEGITDIQDADCVNISYPQFYRDLSSLSE